MASGDAQVNLIPAPKTLLEVHSGLWRGEAVIASNKQSVTHSLSFCIKNPQSYISRETGAQLYGGYFPPTCKVRIIDNKKDRLVFREVCVPSQYIHSVISHPDRFSDLTDLPAYLSKSYSITSNNDGRTIQVNVSKSEKLPPARLSNHSKGSPKDGSVVATKYFSRDIQGTFRYVSSACPHPIKVPTNKELRAEGKPVMSNRDLNKKLKAKLGYNPFQHSE